MYKIIGADGKEYGPVTLDQLRQWIAEGRANAQTKIRPEGATDFKPASELPELAGLFAAAQGALRPSPSIIAPLIPSEPEKALAVTSLVLGVLSFLCFLGPLTGIPAIICGHIARSRSKRLPSQYGGAGMALGGLTLGYASFLYIFLLAAMILPALARAKERAQTINCTNNMKQIGVAFRTWAIDHNEQFPFVISTTNGGTLELCAPGPDGFDRNAASHFAVLVNELGAPRILVCPADTKQPAFSWSSLRAANVTYQLYSTTNLNSSTPEILAICPIHGTELYTDGSVHTKARKRIWH
jgi:hypothetical protein